MSRPARTSRGRWVWGLVVLLALVHDDFWYWDDPTLVFGFLPIGLAYQAGLSVAAAVVWALVMTFAWPSHIEEWAEGLEGEGGRQ